MKTKIVMLSVLLLLILAAGVYFLINKTNNIKKDEKTVTLDKIVVTYADNASGTGLLMELGKKKGFFSNNKIELEKTVEGKDVPTQSAILESNQADVAIQFVYSMIVGFYNNKDLKWIGTVNNYPSSAYIVSKYKLEDLGDIKKVAIPYAGMNKTFLRQAIANLGMNKDAEYLVVAGLDQARLSLLEKDQIDTAIVGSANSLVDIKDKGYYIYQPKDAFAGRYVPKGIMTTSKTLQQKRGILERFVKGTDQTISYLLDQKNKEEIVDLWQEFYKSDKDSAEMAYSNMVESSKGVTQNIDINKIKEEVKLIVASAKPSNPDRSLSELIDESFIVN